MLPAELATCRCFALALSAPLGLGLALTGGGGGSVRGGGVARRNPAGMTEVLKTSDGPLGQVDGLGPFVMREEGDGGQRSAAAGLEVQ